jgi:hypothetical protein
MAELKKISVELQLWEVHLLNEIFKHEIDYIDKMPSTNDGTKNYLRGKVNEIANTIAHGLKTALTLAALETDG